MYVCESTFKGNVQGKQVHLCYEKLPGFLLKAPII